MPPRTPDAQTIPSPRRQLSALLRAQLKRTTRAFTSGSSPRVAFHLFAFITILALLFLSGTQAALSLVDASQKPLLPGETAPAGGVFTDTGFWLAAFLTAFFSFRVMEALYRKQDVRLLAQYPISLSVQFFYRCTAILLEVLAASIALIAFFIPILIQTFPDPRPWGGLALIFAAAWITPTLGVAIQLVAGVSNFGTSPKASENLTTKLGRIDAGGGFPAAFYISPAIGLIGSLILLFLLKMAVVDEFLARGTSRLFYTGLVILSVVPIISLFVARRTFTQHYPYLLARFYESDLIQIDTGYNYHTSATAGARGLIERALPFRVLPYYRKDRLQFGRRYPLLRILHAVFIISYAVALYNDILPEWVIISAPLFYTNLFVSTPSRLYSTELDPHTHLPSKPSQIWLARLIFSLRETFFVSFGVALTILIVHEPERETPFLLASDAFFAPLLLTPLLVSVAARISPLASFVLGVLLTTAATFATTLLTPTMLPVFCSVGLLGLLFLPRKHSTTTH